ncbi:hypothetical protein NPIL_438821, partial [Nephila pilipes]
EKGIFEREGKIKRSSAFLRGREAPAKEKRPVSSSTAAWRGSREVRCRTNGPIATKLSEKDIIH